MITVYNYLEIAILFDKIKNVEFNE